MIRFIRTSLLAPISTLVKETQRIAQGDLATPIAIERQDEIGELLSAFDQMRDTLYQQQLAQAAFEIERKAFIDSISHDLKTPMASISAYLEALQDGIAKTPAEEQDYYRIIKQKIEGLTALSNQLSRSYQTPETVPLHNEELNCHQWADRFLHRVSLECQARGFQLTSTLPSFNDALLIKVDALQLERALQNMLDNAYRFHQHVLAITIDTSDSQFMIQIQNDGAGFLNARQAQVFDRFYTYNHQNADGHLGLGLAISQTLITAMNGTIDTQLAEDVITFSVAIPLIEKSKR